MNRRTFLAAASVGTLIGCTPERPKERGGLNIQLSQDEPCTLLVGVDLSGSFRDMMAEEGKAWSFCTDAIDHYMRATIGSDSELIIAQLSGNNKPLLWQGPVLQIQQDFDADEFRAMLLKKSDASGSRLYDGIADALAYTLAQARGPVVALFLTDMEDTTGAGEARMIAQLAALAQKKGAVGFYYVDQRQLARLHANVVKAGFRNAVMECEIKGRPPLPTFE